MYADIDVAMEMFSRTLEIDGQVLEATCIFLCCACRIEPLEK